MPIANGNETSRPLHHLIPPRQSQIWAVFYPDDTPERLVFSLANSRRRLRLVRA